MNDTIFHQSLRRVKQEPHNDARLAVEATRLAAFLLEESQRRRKLPERRHAARLARMMNDPKGMALTLAMADQVFRPPTASRSAAQFRHLLEKHGLPDYLPLAERLAMQVGAAASTVAPELVMPAVTATMRAQSSAVILPSESSKLRPLLEKRRAEGMRMNLNQLGEAILGEEEADRRLRAILARLADSDCDHISVKISAIHSQIHWVGEEETLDRLAHLLRRIYRAAIKNPAAGGYPKFVNLDMEEYRDLHLTRHAFQRVLDEEEFLKLEAGIVLQAYLPDAWPLQRELNAWARERVGRGGAGIRIRIVKGANLAMEGVDAELHGWPQAPYATKEETDANFKRMLHEGCRAGNVAAVKLGVASHNLFDVAYALLLRARENAGQRIEFEMLEGMANHQARTVREAGGNMLLYAPVVSRQDFHSAIAYLIRRLDENTAEGNFLRDGFDMRPGDAAWERQKQQFLNACLRKDDVAAGPRRTQSRSEERPEPMDAAAEFANEPDTDWSLPANVRWIRSKVNDARAAADMPSIPLVVGGMAQAGARVVAGDDPSRPGLAIYHHALAGPEHVKQALATALNTRKHWNETGIQGRGRVLMQAAAELARARGEAIAAMAIDAGKAVVEADVEVSEAIDFANYYAHSEDNDGAIFEPFGTVLVAPPWNFPFAIPCGSVLAALAAGNTVILKPAPETVLTAWVMVNCLWRAGVPRDVLQFLPCPDDETGRALVTDDRVDAVILTGAYETARLFLEWKPALRLFAETSGKNALIITAAADLDLAVKDLVRSAFGHAGQKCSAASLAIIEAEVYDHPKFRQQLKDAAASLRVGGSGNFDVTMTPLIRKPNDALARAFTRLEPGEEWLLEPRHAPDNPRLWTPGVKLGVAPDSWFRRTECFGPVLGVIRATDLAEAIRIQNDSGFALTGGIHSLDERETELWKDRVEVGNAYINRPITGAIVRRQPFGGWKRSCFGPGAKAGGPNYVAQLGVWKNDSLPSQLADPTPALAEFLERLIPLVPGHTAVLRAAAGSDAYWQRHEFDPDHDPSHLRSEANIFRYRRFGHGILRAGRELPDVDLARLLLVAKASATSISISLPQARPWLAPLGFEIRVEADHELTERLPTSGSQLIRIPGGSSQLKLAAISAGMRWADAPVLWNARREWPAWLREQAISETLHRYGNIVGRPSS
ncbi:MAG: bifunctional proline dehydrogenase/L-glutamate gamma-semialdehyde dehydrogenase [Akkermansiaceae bacterium]